jgi:hypothetical protein
MVLLTTLKNHRREHDFCLLPRYRGKTRPRRSSSTPERLGMLRGGFSSWSVVFVERGCLFWRCSVLWSVGVPLVKKRKWEVIAKKKLHPVST